MKNFVIKSFLFVIAFVFTLVILDTTIKLLNTKKYTSYIDKSEFNNVLIGDSHIQKAINDSLLIDSINFAQTSECYYYSYFKILKLFQIGHPIKKIYLGLNYHSFSSYYDEFIYGNYTLSTIPKYFYLLPLRERGNLLIKNYFNLPSLIRGILKHGIQNLFFDASEMSFIGKYENTFINTSANASSIDKRILFQFYSEDQLRAFSNINLKYFDKIVDICNNNNVELVIIKTPLHQNYKKNIPDQYITKLGEMVSSNDLNMIDLNVNNFDNDYYIRDGDHVSYIGSVEITNYLRKLEDL